VSQALSPGEQHPRATVSPQRMVLLLLAVAIPAVWLWTTKQPVIQEYRLYMTETRKSLDLPWEGLAPDWSEAALKARLRDYPVRCGGDHTRTPGMTRSCYVDLGSLNGVPTMYVNFLYRNDRLERVASAVPWWRHRAARAALVRSFGQPQVTQDRPHAGVRLHGWTLGSGATLFYNADLSANPLETNSIQWLSADACAGRPCIRP
jgi:hypothetical protein